MKGLKLSSLKGELKKVDAKHQKEPARSIKRPGAKIDAEWKRALKERGYSSRFSNYSSCLPLRAFNNFSFDELCKIKYSSIFTMHESVSKLFEIKARYEIVRKIKNSMWRWGCGSGVWNEVVDAYEHIRNFVFHSNSDFEVRLDHSTYHNEYGYAKYSRLFIDGVFAYLIYYKKKHVMTIGFSVMEGRQILIQQVQSAERSGNRFLYRLPANRMEFVIELFQRNFPGYILYVIDAKFLIGKTLRGYRHALELAIIRTKRLRTEVIGATGAEKVTALERLKKANDDVRLTKESIKHLRDDHDRIVTFYKNTGRFKLDSEKFIINNLVHYRVLN